MRYAVVALVVIAVVAVGLWLAFGRGPRRRRAFARAQRLLQQGAWSQALALAQALQAEPRLSPAWRGRLRTLAGECHQRASDQSLKEKRYEDSLRHLLEATALLGLDEGEQRARVIDAMLAEARRLFAGPEG